MMPCVIHPTTPGLTGPPVDSATETHGDTCVMVRGKYLSETMSCLLPLLRNLLKLVFHSLKHLRFCLEKSPGAVPPAGEWHFKISVKSVMGAASPLADMGAGGNVEPAGSF